MRINRDNERGAAFVITAIVLMVLFGFAALGVDIARLAFTATEVQTLADAGALGGLGAVVNHGDAVSGAQAVASVNLADGQPGALDAGDVQTGVWDNGTFTPGSSPYNAVHVDAHVTVNNILAGILSTPTSKVTKGATAAFRTLGRAAPSLPIALGKCFQCYPSDCSSGPVTLYFSSTTANNAAWITFYSNSGVGSIKDFVPSGCGGGGSSIPVVNTGDTVSLDNGQKNALCSSFTCLINQEFLIPIVGLSCGTPFNGAPVVGFATVTILAVDCQGSNKSITVQPTILDCQSTIGETLCKGSAFGGSCLECGTGTVVLVQ